MAGVPNSWTTARATYAGHQVTLETLTGKPTVQLAFMRMPDGNIDGSGFASTGRATLMKLYQGTITTVPTVDTPRQTYTLQQVVDTLGAVITSMAATTVRTLDNVDGFGEGDHSDHLSIARMATMARDQHAPTASLVGFYGYPGAALPENVTGGDLTSKVAAFEAYAPDDWNMCLTLADCAAAGRPEALWLKRSHPVSESPGSGGGGSGGGAAGVNVAGTASVTASSQNASTGQLASSAVDGVAAGYPANTTAEWADPGWWRRQLAAAGVECAGVAGPRGPVRPAEHLRPGHRRHADLLRRVDGAGAVVDQ